MKLNIKIISFISLFVATVFASDRDDFYENDTRAELFKKTDFIVPKFKIEISDEDYKKLFLKLQCEKDMNKRSFVRNDDCYTAPWVNLHEVAEKSLKYGYINKTIVTETDLKIIKNENITLTELESIVTKYIKEPFGEYLSYHNLISIPSDKTNDYQVNDAKLTFELDGNVSEYSVKFSLGGKGTRKFGKQGYNIKLGKKADLFGRKQIRLRADLMDPSFLRDKLSYDVCNVLDLPTLSSNYAELYINGKYMGFYVMRDAFKTSWIKQRFGDDSTKYLYTCDRSYGSSSFFNCINDDEDLRENDTDFKEFQDRLANTTTVDELKEFFDVETFTKWQVVKYLLGAWDHVNYAHNIYLYLYHDKTNGNDKWIPLLYDFDNTFGAYFSYITDLSFNEYFYYNQELEYTLHGEKYSNQLFKILKLNDKNKDVKRLIREVMIKVFNPDILLPRVDKLKNFLDPYIKLDRTRDEEGKLPGRFERATQYVEDNYTYKDFLVNTEFTNIIINQYTIQNAVVYGIKGWIIERFKYACIKNGLNCSFASKYLEDNYSENQSPEPIKYENNCKGSGLKCCSSKVKKIKGTDKYGNELGWEDNDWCFLNKEEEDIVKYCRGTKYNCCSSYVVDIHFVDETGYWSIEGGDWCLLPEDFTKNISRDEIYDPEKPEKEIPEKEIPEKEIPEKDNDFCRGTEYPCCRNKNSKVIYTDSKGDWAYENNEWCLYDFEPTCWSTELNVPCCKLRGTKVDNRFKSPDGKNVFGIEYNQKCGINDIQLCPSGGLLYSCCKKTCTIVKTENNKNFGEEDGHLCSIPYSCSENNENQCARAYEPCGGINYPNSPTCCETGYYCETRNEYYHQCYPITHFHDEELN
ncbi:hypothetical protein BCR32DRAFT_276928 [Anaeromyces robustus]|uniref:Coth-domain-containing protein n=1 Tax=Anaeromyces robustus TaxID=1754192 RepID=A0A1Y1XGX7_9FUNG|nr:hypothetical protein BCR32DRAFT_276928 [Anaeromyces robustus]|eukprot:ORX84656.1 hypothetical protein BCR32DRAFT_276928 [Anaeromyces robustus]